MLPTLDDVLADFDASPDPRERLRLLVELGAELPPFPAEAYTPENLVRGCQSQVWLLSEPSTTPGRLVFRASADAQIVKGLVALILMLFSERTADEILAVDAEATFHKLDLAGQLTPGRQNGLHAMVARIRALAEERKS
jgi:cysteine desulfuration protein SufE